MAPSRYGLTMRGPISRTVPAVVRTRFDHVSTPGADGTVPVVDDVDQASVRALLTLLWDTGHHVLAFEEKTA
ncbi:hypothetical protein ACFY4I_38395 [Streptomyces scabiei]|uniref:hypothetical protein n=1 Tax=Streptomyces scabiei TaxID=1930 RepID=UPI0036A1444B